MNTTHREYQYHTRHTHRDSQFQDRQGSAYAYAALHNKQSCITTTRCCYPCQEANNTGTPVIFVTRPACYRTYCVVQFLYWLSPSCDSVVHLEEMIKKNCREVDSRCVDIKYNITPITNIFYTEALRAFCEFRYSPDSLTVHFNQMSSAPL